MTETSKIPTETATAPAPAPLNFLQKLQLFKKKYDYVNGKGLAPADAEEAARKDLSLPAMTEAERAEAAKPSILQRILDNKIVVALGITEFFTRKRNELKENLKAKVDEKLGNKPAENVSAPTATSAPTGVVASAQPTQAPAPTAAVQDSSTPQF